MTGHTPRAATRLRSALTAAALAAVLPVHTAAPVHAQGGSDPPAGPPQSDAGTAGQLAAFVDRC